MTQTWSIFSKQIQTGTGQKLKKSLFISQNYKQHN